MDTFNPCIQAHRSKTKPIYFDQVWRSWRQNTSVHSYTLLGFDYSTMDLWILDGSSTSLNVQTFRTRFTSPPINFATSFYRCKVDTLVNLVATCRSNFRFFTMTGFLAGFDTFGGDDLFERGFAGVFDRSWLHLDAMGAIILCKQSGWPLD